MAVGNGGVFTSKASCDAFLASAAATCRSFYDQVNKYYYELNRNLSTTAQQSAAGYSVAGDQALITAFIGDLNRLRQVIEGTNPGSFTDQRADYADIQGWG